MKKYVWFLLAIALFAGCSKDNPTQPPKVEYATFNVTFKNFKINDDGNSLTKGKFYYVVAVTDGKDSIYKDENGKDAVIILPRANYSTVGSGDDITLNTTFKGIKIAKEYPQTLNIRFKIWDYFASGNDVLVGDYLGKYPYPDWSFPLPGYYGNLKSTVGSYDVSLFWSVDVQ